LGGATARPAAESDGCARLISSRGEILGEVETFGAYSGHQRKKRGKAETMPTSRWAFYRLLPCGAAECLPEVEQAVKRVEAEYGLIGRCGWARETGSELARGA
jgi:hypothetical protein